MGSYTPRTLLTVGITAVLLASQMLEVTVPRSLIPTSQPAAPSRPSQGATPVTKMSATDATEKSAVSPASAPPAPAAEDAPPASAAPAEDAPPASEPHGLAVGARAQVANTDGLGVVFYAAPRDSARLPAGLLEGTAVSVLELSGEEWARVQSDAKKAGWVRAAYLAPAE